MSYEDLLLAIVLDTVAISLFTLAIYFPRHQRRDLVLAFFGVNVGLFSVAVFISDHEINLALGLGLFALLSVVRLRSAEISQEDIGYYFVALVLGLINGFARSDEWDRIVTLDALLLAVMYIADHPRLVPNRRQYNVTLDAVFPNEEALRLELERRLGATITRVIVLRTDFVHKHTVVDVRLRLDRPNAGGSPPHAPS